ncbi:hypothetical protein ASPWEDRAFT_171964 [Aspergillus wentii DTO 134E9]|uniref:Uncharacterized protein n=1 Tax=Aspergillus wentii DTO 134E9 TaxID=1073089 RepID=A0A1L9RJP0_ASPWE|nr:uncharacterized protein ASPWEDRAFT_171964 [Aspergillus wentii DTO 134E9]OJJ35135.1 hypothetical protein ASPWEDRAFT_171964 [Aspergillus wentii DTO 134E9]
MILRMRALPTLLVDSARLPASAFNTKAEFLSWLAPGYSLCDSLIYRPESQDSVFRQYPVYARIVPIFAPAPCWSYPYRTNTEASPELTNPRLSGGPESVNHNR